MSDVESVEPCNDDLRSPFSPDTEVALAAQWGAQRVLKGQQTLPWNIKRAKPTLQVQPCVPSSFVSSEEKKAVVVMSPLHPKSDASGHDGLTLVEPVQASLPLMPPQSAVLNNAALPDVNSAKSQEVPVIMAVDDAWAVSPDSRSRSHRAGLSPLARSTSSTSTSMSTSSSSESADSCPPSPSLKATVGEKQCSGANDMLEAALTCLGGASGDWQMISPLSCPARAHGGVSRSHDEDTRSRSPRCKAQVETTSTLQPSAIQEEVPKMKGAHVAMRGGIECGLPVEHNGKLSCLMQRGAVTPPPKPDAPPGVDHWLHPLWSALQQHWRGKPWRRVGLESLCSGTAAELHALEVTDRKALNSESMKNIASSLTSHKL